MQAVLKQADLSGTDLEGANMKGADLSGVKAVSANLTWADLREADLTGGGSFRIGSSLDSAGRTRISARPFWKGWCWMRTSCLMRNP